MEKIFSIEGNMEESREALKEIKGLLGDYDLVIFDEEDWYEYVAHMVTEISCFGNSRLFIIKKLPQIKIEKSKDKPAPTQTQIRTKTINNFKKLFSSIPVGNVVVFYNVGISAESFSKEVKKYGKVYKFNQKISKSDAKTRINKYFQQRNISVSMEIAGLIAQSLNVNGDDVDIDKLNLLVKKMYNYVYGKKKITEDDVYMVCSFSKDFVIWSLYKFLDAKEYEASLRLVEPYLENVKYFNFEVEMMLKGMIWRYGLLLMIKSGINNKISEKEIESEISNINKMESTGKGTRIKLLPKLKNKKRVPKYSYKMIMSVLDGYGRGALNCYTESHLNLIYYVLTKTLLKVRSGCTISESKLALKLNMLAICGKIRKKNTLDGALECRKMAC
jgi:DNA polymerase III delta subunit